MSRSIPSLKLQQRSLRPSGKKVPAIIPYARLLFNLLLSLLLFLCLRFGYGRILLDTEWLPGEVMPWRPMAALLEFINFFFLLHVEPESADVSDSTKALIRAAADRAPQDCRSTHRTYFVAVWLAGGRGGVGCSLHCVTDGNPNISLSFINSA